MNFPQNASTAPTAAQPLPMQPMQGDGDEINLLELLDVLVDSKWLIASVTAIVLAIGVSYALFATPIYEANTLIQVEDNKAGGMGTALGELGNMFDIKSPASAEIEILRSRFVIGQAVDNLDLDIDVSPNYLPVIGRWLARGAQSPSTPGIFGFGGYVSGNESMKVPDFQVPRSREGQPYTVKVTTDGYELKSPDDDVVGKGRAGEILNFQDRNQNGKLMVSALVGKPGAEFALTRFSTLSVIQMLQTNITLVEQGKPSGIIRSGLEGTDPKQIAAVLNEIGGLYVRQNIARKAAEAEKSLAFLNSQLPQLRRELETSEEKFNQFRNQKGTFDLTSEAKVLLDQGVALRVRQLELQQKREELSARFTPQHPSIQVIDTQLREVTGQLAVLENRGKTFPNVEQDLLRLTRDVKVNNDLYTGLLNSFQQLRLVKEGQVGNVRLVDVAVAPEIPIKPKKSIIVAIAAVLGLILGLGLALIRSGLRPGLSDPADIESRTGLNVFATVPHSEVQVQQAKDIKAKKPGSHVLAVVAPQDAVVESLRSLRTALQFAMLDTPSKVVVISGPTPGIGKSFTSVNFAVVLGAANKRVLLIDADMRRGHLNQYFGFARERGLSEVVSGSIAVNDALHRNVAPNVDFLATGTLPPNPAELLMAHAMHALLDTMSEQYDVIILDTPPVLAASDTAILAPMAGAVFLVARAEVSTLGELQESAKRLGQIGVQPRGVIFNDVTVSKRRLGYGYKYANYQYTDYKY